MSAVGLGGCRAIRIRWVRGFPRSPVMSTMGLGGCHASGPCSPSSLGRYTLGSRESHGPGSWSSMVSDHGDMGLGGRRAVRLRDLHGLRS